MIRPFEPADAAGVVALVRRVAVDWATSPRGLVHRLGSHPERAHHQAWLAEEDGSVVGFARPRLLWEIGSERVGSFWLAVREDRRRRGVGRALLDEAAAHLRAAGAVKLESFAEEEPGRRFLAAFGLVPRGIEHVSVLDPARAEFSALAGLEERARECGFRAEALEHVRAGPRDLHAVYAGALVDVPGAFVADDVRYEEWTRECLDDPDLSHSGSVVVLAGERPVALSFLMSDGSGRAATDMTGTLPAYRRRGLARLAKLGTVRWAAENGVETMLTGNDDDNAAMLALNRSLGYRPLAERTFFLGDAR